jgi:hypothetical protein
MAGSDASDERVLKATACAGAHARANRRRGMPPASVAMGYRTTRATERGNGIQDDEGDNQ